MKLKRVGCDASLNTLRRADALDIPVGWGIQTLERTRGWPHTTRAGTLPRQIPLRLDISRAAGGRRPMELCNEPDMLMELRGIGKCMYLC